MTLSQIQAKISQTYELESLWLKRSRNTIIIDLIAVKTEARGKGHGKGAMDALCSYADHKHLSLSLIPSPEYGSNKQRLTDWYRTFGFILQEDGSMIRGATA